VVVGFENVTGLRRRVVDLDRAGLDRGRNVGSGEPGAARQRDVDPRADFELVRNEGR
jgi:hypothetical protein